MQSRQPKPKPKLDENELFDYAVRSLANRAASSDELRAKLRRRAARFPDVDTVIARLKELNYLDDKRFAEMFTALRVEGDGFGKMRVLHDLQARRVPSKLAGQAVARAFENKDEQGMIRAYIERRMPAVAAGGKLGDERQLAAAWRKLRRAGFSSGATLTVLKGYAADPGILDEPPPEDDAEGG